MKTTRRSFLGLLGAGAAAAAACRMPERGCSEPEPEAPVLEPEEAPYRPDHNQIDEYDLNTNLGTLRVRTALLAFPDDEPEGLFRFFHRDDWIQVWVVDGRIEKETIGLLNTNSHRPEHEVVCRIEGTITMRKRNGSTFTARIC